ncbi:hypothetical protein NBRC116592_04810 [Colwellia sp. KU-HH00111]|uniref:hypothetical protein n=1 Tax=Colwellia sp. KU-HH00111 TaxID=3127652 RepID=UPI00310257F3
MFRKDYYRLGELESKFGFSAYDYIYLCEKFNNPIRFYAHKHYFLMMDLDLYKKKLLGVAYYKGVINLLPQYRNELLQSGSVEIEECYLTDKKFIELYEEVSPELVVNCFDEKYEVTSLRPENIQATNIYSRVIGEENRDMVQKEVTKLDCRLNLKLEDMVLTNDDISWARLSLKMSNNEKVLPESERENTFHIYAKHLINFYPGKGASALWNIILKKHHEEDDEIDPYCILIEVYPDEIIWAVKGDTERTMKKSTFKNLITKLKK